MLFTGCKFDMRTLRTCYAVKLTLQNFCALSTFSFKNFWHTDFNFTVGGFPLAVVIAIIGSILAIVVYLTSTYEEPPKYQWAFGYAGFLVSVVWIYAFANEVVDLLHAIGIMFDLSDSILGLTVLAWGNSIGGKSSGCMCLQLFKYYLKQIWFQM